MKLNPGKQPPLPKAFHWLLNHAVGTTVRHHGEPATGPTLYVSNHLSWADIPILGRYLRARFVAKSDIADTDVLKFFCAQQRTMYVDRGDPRGSREQKDRLTEALAAGDSCIVFPEATTNDGRRPMPFKTPLFQGLMSGEAPGVKVQPISIAFTRVQSMPTTRARLPFLCWLGDYGIGESVMDWLRMRSIRADVIFHDPVDPSDFPDRKALAAYCYNTIHRGYRRAMRDYAGPQ
ncbi:MAG: lysophospholipid acyltransferase family protein [Pacificimonas sp.]|jgi:1-acyl-sn-glycerol-3-phosphate acyltransferase|nr:lysophospholipid acyltransferase family protein [Pacificimonas sp.]